MLRIACATYSVAFKQYFATKFQNKMFSQKAVQLYKFQELFLSNGKKL